MYAMQILELDSQKVVYEDTVATIREANIIFNKMYNDSSVELILAYERI